MSDSEKDAKKPAKAKSKKEPPQIQIRKSRTPAQSILDEFWKSYKSEHCGRVSTVLPPSTQVKRSRRKIPSVALRESVSISYDAAVAICKARVETIIRECQRTNQNFIDADFRLESLKNVLFPLAAALDFELISPGAFKRVKDIFDAPKFFIKGATVNDVRQGLLGNCWMASAVCALTNKEGLIEKLCPARNEEIAVYGFVFFRDGEWISTVIDDFLFLKHKDYASNEYPRALLHSVGQADDDQEITAEEKYRQLYQSNSSALLYGTCQDPNETWFPLLEKAFAKAHGASKSLLFYHGHMNTTSGGKSVPCSLLKAQFHPLSILTKIRDYGSLDGGFGFEALEDFTGGVSTITSPNDILDTDAFWKQLLQVNDKFLFCCSSHPEREKVPDNFDVLTTDRGILGSHEYSVIRAVEMEGKRLLLLRNPHGQGEWNGAWKYLDTKFSFTIAKAALVVIVLTKLDETYFQGLKEGPYSFTTSFRVEKIGEGSTILEIDGLHAIARSILAELELGAGEYQVSVKIKTLYESSSRSIEQIVRKNIVTRSEKVLQTGLRYDEAHFKAKLEDEEYQREVAKQMKESRKARLVKKLRAEMTKVKRREKHTANKKKRKLLAAKLKKLASARAKTPDPAPTPIPRVLKRTRQSTKKSNSEPAIIEATTTTTIVEIDNDSDSSITSSVSSISTDEVESEIEKLRQEAYAKKIFPLSGPPPTQPQSESPFPDDGSIIPDWNACLVLGLRVYALNSDVELRIIRPEWEPRDESEESGDDELMKEIVQEEQRNGVKVVAENDKLLEMITSL
ncbi:cysteine proteinase [Mollisia scopiformis]|uniref:Cysteine proteinase n=1 Tax=Mollisia scopiformis TaxID=149040 RepID=A0A194XCR3_MOLSC|nr:cysteine proteinase [Mollisia scopiformis]KUJ17949.1 cysteine proteinase [Mollisia scopiformis]